MTVSTDLNRKDYNHDGVSASFAFPYYFLAAADLTVVETVIATGVETPLVLDSDYTVTGAGNPAGGTVLRAAQPAGIRITILRELDILQGQDYVENDAFPAEALERGLDRLTMICQQLLEKFARSLLLPVGSTISNLKIPGYSAGKFWRWNPLSEELENADVTGLGAIGVPVSLADGGTGASHATVASLFGAIKQAATELATGVAKIATQAVANAGADDADFITALKLWTTPMRGGWKNILGDNGGLEIWQRGAGGSASFAVPASTTTGQYTADRWYLGTQANEASTVSQQAGLNANSGSCARVQRNAGQTGTVAMVFAYPLDSNEIRRLRGKKPSFRCELRAGANWSPANGRIQVLLATSSAAGPAKRGYTPYTGEVQAINATIDLTPGAAAVIFSAVGAAPAADITQAELLFVWVPTGTAGAADYFEVDDVDLRAAEPVIDQFERRPFFDELSACQVHFWKSFDYGTAPAQNAGAADTLGWPSVVGASVATRSPQFACPRQMRATPTVTTYNPNAANAQARNISDGADCSATSVNTYGQGRAIQILTTTSAGTAANENLAVHVTCDAGI